jgi:mono/diheme cytochrome c family protein
MNMKKIAVLAAGGLLVMAALGAVACSNASAQAGSAKIARGQYLVTVGGCNDCHTPLKMGPKGPEPDMTRMLSGHPEQFVISAPARMTSTEWMSASAPTNTAHSGPWGVSFTANLTPDENTGLGIWTEDMFIKALRTGRHMGASREILPPMPWSNYGKMTDDDLKAVFAYLRSIPPVHNRVPDPLPPATVTSTN